MVFLILWISFFTIPFIVIRNKIGKFKFILYFKKYFFPVKPKTQAPFNRKDHKRCKDINEILWKPCWRNNAIYNNIQVIAEPTTHNNFKKHVNKNGIHPYDQEKFQ